MEKSLIVILSIMGIFGTTSGFLFYRGISKSNVDYAEGTNFSIKEDSVTRRRPVFFFSPLYRSRGPSGGGIGYGK